MLHNTTLLLKKGKEIFMITVKCPAGDHKFHSPYEAAAEMGISKQSLDRYRKEGFIQGYLMGNGYHFLEEDIRETLRYLAEKKLRLGNRNVDRENINISII